MRIIYDSSWDSSIHWEYYDIDRFANDVEMLDKAHKRAKKELRKQQRAIARKNEYIKCYKEMYDNVVKQYSQLNRTLEAFLDSRMVQEERDIKQRNEISNLELKVACLEHENKSLRKQQTNQEKVFQERIIQSMNDIIVELRTQLNETEEKYNELLKHVINEK